MGNRTAVTLGVVALLFAAAWLSLRSTSTATPMPDVTAREDEAAVTVPSSAATAEVRHAAMRPPDPATHGALASAMSTATTKSSDPDARVADQLAGLYSQWSDETFDTLFAEGVNPLRLQEPLDWFRAKLGSCGAPTLHSRRETMVRFMHECERGTLEMGFPPASQGKLRGMVMGASGVDPVDDVLEAARAVMSLMNTWDDALFERTFADVGKRGSVQETLARERERSGHCSLGEPDLVSARGALLFLECERDVRLMKVEIDENDKIDMFFIRAPRPGPD